MLSALPVLIICSDSAHGNKAAEIVRDMSLTPVICASLTEARSRMERRAFQLVLCDDELPDCNLRTALKVLSSAIGGVPVIVLSHVADWDAYVKALSAGAFDYIACPPERIETERILRLALSQNLRSRRVSRNAASAVLRPLFPIRR
jgi:DNA-binding NtrC family response regulator